MTYPKSLQNHITELESLPGIGPKMAGRIALSLFKYPSKIEIIRESLSGITTLKKCIKCNSISDSEVCSICADKTREGNIIKLKLKYAFHKSKIDNTKSKEMIEDELKKLTGSRMILDTYVGGSIDDEKKPDIVKDVFADLM